MRTISVVSVLALWLLPRASVTGEHTTMLMRVCVTDIETGEVLFLRQFSPRQRVRGLTLGSAPDDDIQVTTLGQQKLRVILRGRKSVLLTQGFQPTATTMQASDREFELRVTSGSMLEIDGQRVEFAAAGGAGKSVAGTTATPAAVPSTEDREAKTCFARLFLTLVHELARMERGAEAMMTEFDMPAGDSGSEPFDWARFVKEVLYLLPPLLALPLFVMALRRPRRRRRQDEQ